VGTGPGSPGRRGVTGPEFQMEAEQVRPEMLEENRICQRCLVAEPHL